MKYFSPASPASPAGRASGGSQTSNPAPAKQGLAGPAPVLLYSGEANEEVWKRKHNKHSAAFDTYWPSVGGHFSDIYQFDPFILFDLFILFLLQKRFIHLFCYKNLFR